MKRIKVLFILILLLSCFVVNAQQDVEMADMMRSNGRIYVVIAVMLTILLGLVLYVVRLDRKISRLEKNK